MIKRIIASSFFVLAGCDVNDPDYGLEGVEDAEFRSGGTGPNDDAVWACLEAIANHDDASAIAIGACSFGGQPPTAAQQDNCDRALEALEYTRGALSACAEAFMRLGWAPHIGPPGSGG